MNVIQHGGFKSKRGCWHKHIYQEPQAVCMSSSVGATTIGPVEHSVRDEIAEYRDENNYPNYNAALQAMLEEVTAES